MLRSVGSIEPYPKKIRLNSDRKRNWSGEIQSLQVNKNTFSPPERGFVRMFRVMTWGEKAAFVMMYDSRHNGSNDG